MNLKQNKLIQAALVSVLMTVVAGTSAEAQEVPEERILRGNNLTITLLHQEFAEDGSSFEMAEIIFQPSYQGGDHNHPVTEMFYVIEGQLEHVVNGEMTLLGPGMFGLVRPPDAVAHRVRGDVPVRAIVTWQPAGEFERITGRDLGGGA